MTDTNVIKLAEPGTSSDSLTEILRNGARALLRQAVEVEVADFLGRYAELKIEAPHAKSIEQEPKLDYIEQTLELDDRLVARPDCQRPPAACPRWNQNQTGALPKLRTLSSAPA